MAIFHLSLLAAVHLVPRWIFGYSVFSYLWWQHTIGSLAGAQYSLLASFWAISPWKWSKRTVLLIGGLVALTLMRVLVYFFQGNRHDSPLDALWFLLLDQIRSFIGIALVLAVCLELLRPFWGVLSREPVEHTEHLTIFALFQLTSIAAVAALVLRIGGSFLDAPVWFSIQLLLDTALLASCIWMMLAPRYAWVGVAGCSAAIVGGVLNTPVAITATYGPWHWLPSLCLKTIWICSTHLVVRYFGFRMRKHSLNRTVPLPDRLLTENA